DRATMSQELRESLARFDVPDDRRAVVAGRDNELLIVRERRRPHPPAMPDELMDLLACGNIPQARRPVVRSSEQFLPVVGKGDRVDCIAMTGKSSWPQRLAGLGVPHGDELTGTVASSRDVAAIG